MEFLIIVRLQLYCADVLVDLKSVFDNLDDTTGNPRNSDKVTFAMLSDELPANHISLATFAHYKMRWLTDRLNEPGILRKVHDFLGADTPPHDELNYSVREVRP